MLKMNKCDKEAMFKKKMFLAKSLKEVCKPIIRIPEDTFDRLEAYLSDTGQGIYSKEGRDLLNYGFNCLEIPGLIFIDSAEPEKNNKIYPYWRKVFKNKVII